MHKRNTDVHYSQCHSSLHPQRRQAAPCILRGDDTMSYAELGLRTIHRIKPFMRCHASIHKRVAFFLPLDLRGSNGP